MVTRRSMLPCALLGLLCACGDSLVGTDFLGQPLQTYNWYSPETEYVVMAWYSPARTYGGLTALQPYPQVSQLRLYDPPPEEAFGVAPAGPWRGKAVAVGVALGVRTSNPAISGDQVRFSKLAMLGLNNPVAVKAPDLPGGVEWFDAYNDNDLARDQLPETLKACPQAPGRYPRDYGPFHDLNFTTVAPDTVLTSFLNPACFQD